MYELNVYCGSSDSSSFKPPSTVGPTAGGAVPVNADIDDDDDGVEGDDAEEDVDDDANAEDEPVECDRVDDFDEELTSEDDAAAAADVDEKTIWGTLSLVFGVQMRIMSLNKSTKNRFINARVIAERRLVSVPSPPPLRVIILKLTFTINMPSRIYFRPALYIPCVSYVQHINSWFVY